MHYTAEDSMLQIVKIVVAGKKQKTKRQWGQPSNFETNASSTSLIILCRHFNFKRVFLLGSIKVLKFFRTPLVFLTPSAIVLVTAAPVRRAIWRKLSREAVRNVNA